jgi:uncharacterized membrane protein
MSKDRLEAFSDGVFAVLITIMVLELKVPHGTDWASLSPLLPVFLTYILSFIFLGIYWNNHHHMLQATEAVNGTILWANLHLLFWLSLTPFVTNWMGATRFASAPVAVYGIVLLCAAIAYFILTRVLIAHHGTDSALAAAVGRDRKGKISIVIYAAGIVLAPTAPWLAGGLYALVALMWLVPDRRIEQVLVSKSEP